MGPMSNAGHLINIVAPKKHKMSDTGFPGNPNVSNDEICYITISGGMSLLCRFCINMTLRSEARVFACIIATLSVCIFLLVCVTNSMWSVC